MLPDTQVAWLMDSDPALRWQVQRDLLREPSTVWETTRARVSTEGFGAQLLALQDPDGQWAGGAYFPADFDPRTDAVGQPWTATTWTLNTLREWGLSATALGNTAELLAKNARWEYENLPYWGGEVDCCINGYTLANGVWLGADVSELSAWFVEHQMGEGGWNCEWVDGSTRSSFHSTLNSLKGLLAYESSMTTGPELRAARHAGEEYLLSRNLFRRLSTGEPVAPWTTRFVYPSRWVYTVLGAADYFRQAALHDAIGPDSRMSAAIDLIRDARQSDGTWLQGAHHPGTNWFDVDVPEGEPSRWLTLVGTRVLAWWDEGRDAR